MSFLLIQLLKELSSPLHLTYSLSSFIFIIFPILNLFWILILFHKKFQQFSTLKITNMICPRRSVLNIFNPKNFFRPTWNIAFCNFFLYFDIVKISPIYKVISLLESIYMLGFTSTGIYIDFNCSMIYIIIFI